MEHPATLELRADEQRARVAEVVTHIARERVQSYCGVPIWLDGGRLWGTLCHYDVRPRLLPHAEVEVLERVAALFAAHVVRMTPAT